MLVLVTFREFDTTSEVSASDGRRFMVVSVTFDIEYAGRKHSAVASVGISQAHGRKTYEIIDEPWAAVPQFAAALVEYVQEAERSFRFSDLSQRLSPRELERSRELELDPTLLAPMV